MMPNPSESMAETTKDCFSNDDILANFSNLDADLQSLGPSRPALYTSLEEIILSPPKSPIYPTNPASIDEQDSFDSTSTVEATWPFLKTIHLSVPINLTPRIRGLSPSHPPRKYPFEGLPENHYLP